MRKNCRHLLSLFIEYHRRQMILVVDYANDCRDSDFAAKEFPQECDESNFARHCTKERTLDLI